MSGQPAPAQETPEGQPSPGKKGKKAKKGKGASSGGLTIAGHPRAGAHVRKAKGWGGLIAFGVTAYLSLSAGLSPDQVGLRALAAGIAGYLLGWGCSVTIWRHLLIAELRALAEHAQSRPGARAATSAPAPLVPGEAGEASQ